VLEAMLKGNRTMNIKRIADPDAREKLQEVAESFTEVSELVGRILEKTPELFQAQHASNNMFINSEDFLNESTELMRAYAAQEQSRILSSTTGYLFGALAVVFLILLGSKLVRDARTRLEETEKQNQENQEAILTLLEEIGDLADGDLTTNATVTESFTGAIADAINFAIDALRKLVTTINETTVQVSSAAQETQATAMHLAEASDHQAQQITAVSAAVNQMAASIEQVSQNAASSTDVAQKSVSIANKGAKAVQDTIHGMNSIRETIQETSKRIKRLGESSQEIGDIIELINDIADQTNILALNAAIQAAMAGEAGRGFAVVADEVQRLAERSSDATKQIESLVRTIQSDTNEAVASMEQSTSGVVNGAKLAQHAGEALGEIENVSNHLAEIIQNITDAAQQQSVAASSISETMNVIQEVTTQTSAGTNETATSIGNLAELANELRKSVAGFKLPN
jgi:twitching motility protein PilJ